MIETDVRNVLIADVGPGGVATMLTGGIYTYEQTGRLGINRNSTPDAFDSVGLKPCAVIKSRAKMPDGQITDLHLQWQSARQVVEIWIYQDGDVGYSVIDQAVARIYTLLQARRVNGKPVRWQQTLDRPPRDESLNMACFSRIDFQVLAIQGD